MGSLGLGVNSTTWPPWVRGGEWLAWGWCQFHGMGSLRLGGNVCVCQLHDIGSLGIDFIAKAPWGWGVVQFIGSLGTGDAAGGDLNQGHENGSLGF